MKERPDHPRILAQCSSQAQGVKSAPRTSVLGMPDGTKEYPTKSSQSTDLRGSLNDCNLIPLRYGMFLDSNRFQKHEVGLNCDYCARHKLMTWKWLLLDSVKFIGMLRAPQRQVSRMCALDRKVWSNLNHRSVSLGLTTRKESTSFHPLLEDIILADSDTGWAHCCKAVLSVAILVAKPRQSWEPGQQVTARGRTDSSLDPGC